MHSFDRLVLTLLLVVCVSCSRAKAPDLTVTVVPAVEGLTLTAAVPVVLDPPGLTLQAQAGQPLHFSQVQRGQTYRIRAGSGFVGPEASVTIHEDGQATVRLSVIQIDPAAEPAGKDAGAGEPKTLVVDLGSKDAMKLAWKEGRATLASREVRSTDDLPSVFEDEWKSFGMHHSEKDPERDPARILVKPDTPLDWIEPVAKAILGVKRKSLGSGAVVEISAFTVRVAAPPAIDPEESAEQELDAADSAVALTAEELDAARKRAASIRAIGVELWGKLSAGGGNLAFSPLSIMGCAALANEGASGKTGAQLRRLLRAPADADAMRAQLKALLKASRSRSTANAGTGDKVKVVRLQVAHGIWAQQDNPLRAEYMSGLQRDFDARAANVDFQRDASGAAKLINDWIHQHTFGKIKEAVSPAMVGADLRAVLVDAVYFRGRFARPFEKRRTEPAEFRLADGVRVSVPTMRDTRTLDYVKGQGFQAVRVPYTVQDFSLVLILPDEGQLDAIEKRLGSVLDQAVGKARSERVFLSLPRVALSWKRALAAPLRALGVTDAWDGKVADFSRLTDVGGFHLSELIHATTLTIREDGTEATAATLGFGSGTGRAEPVTLRFDRPFLFAIHDAWVGTFLFLGRVSDPR